MSDFLTDEDLVSFDTIISSLKNVTSSRTFINLRNEHIIVILKSFANEPTNWYENAKSTFEGEMGELRIRIKGAQKTLGDLNINLTDSSIDKLFASLFKFIIEAFFSDFTGMHIDIMLIRNFTLMNLHEFRDEARSEITYNIHAFPLKLLKGIVTSSEFKSLSEFNDSLHSAKRYAETHLDPENGKIALGIVGIRESITNFGEDLINQNIYMNKYIAEKITETKAITDTLKDHKTEANFVKLYDGFNALSTSKKQERNNAKWLTFILSVFILIPVFIEIYFLSRMDKNFMAIFSTTKDSPNLVASSSDGFYSYLHITIPMISIFLILIYYFRISLQNLNSLKSQVDQIELRKSLVSFIQTYGEFSKEVQDHNKESLKKFEDIIFSNIMPNADTIPSTYDGLEQLSKLISSVKGGKS